MRIGAVQMCSGINIEENIDAADDLIRRAVKDGAQFVATPEMTHILQKNPKHLFAQITSQDADKGVRHFSELAAELGIDLLIGSLAIKTGDNSAANRSLLFGPDGGLKAAYDKIHLFDVQVSKKETWKESRVYDAGQRAVIASIKGANLGLSICYDVRFASLYRHYGQNGADIIAVPAAFTRPTGAAHWETLLRARAIETGCFIIAPAQGGRHADGRATWGHSMIIDPWGEILASSPDDKPGFICADIDIKAVETIRGKIPAWNYETGWSGDQI